MSSGSGAPAKRRIYQGEETPGFMSLFKNNLIVIRRGQRPQTATAAATMEMFEAKCQPGDPTKRLVSVECRQDSLHSSVSISIARTHHRTRTTARPQRDCSC